MFWKLDEVFFDILLRVGKSNFNIKNNSSVCVISVCVIDCDVNINIIAMIMIKQMLNQIN